jgi:hypothetical protein
LPIRRSSESSSASVSPGGSRSPGSALTASRLLRARCADRAGWLPSRWPVAASAWHCVVRTS